MRIVIIVLLAALLVVQIMAYILCIKASEAEQRAEEMRKKNEQIHKIR